MASSQNETVYANMTNSITSEGKKKNVCEIETQPKEKSHVLRMIFLVCLQLDNSD